LPDASNNSAQGKSKDSPKLKMAAIMGPSLTSREPDPSVPIVDDPTAKQKMLQSEQIRQLEHMRLRS
jgi:hypothetical protein